MRRLLPALLLTAILHFPAYGALPTATAWEIRTLGNANNGGCYVTGSTGTDFTQQNAAQYTGTDLVLATATTATSVSHSFVSTDVGNCIHITAGTGFTAGFYQIVSVSLGTATLDRAAGSMGSTAGTYAVGGAVVSPVTVNANTTAGNQVWVKADGTYTFVATLGITIDSSNKSPYRWTGYTTVRGDNGRATWTTATNSINIVQVASGTVGNVEFDNISFTTTAGTKLAAIAAQGANGYDWVINNCVIDGFTRGINGDFGTIFLFSPLIVVNSEIRNSVGDGINNSSNVIVMGSYIHNNGADGISVSANGDSTEGAMIISFSVVKSNTTNGFEMKQNGTVRNNYFPYITNSIFMSNGGDGVKVNNNNSYSQSLNMWNTVLYSNTGWGIEYDTNPASPLNAYSNAYGSNGSGNRNNVGAGVGDVALTANPFVNSASNNFALNSTSGGGAALRAVGYPGILPVGGTGFIDIGMLQSQSSAGAGTTVSGYAQ